ncbi:MAG: hypothetical protein K0S71_1281 [Clostridia bacterium]|jgi:O-antigen ligase|nr:hypothetical protein [Clostridia bacterium]
MPKEDKEKKIERVSTTINNILFIPIALMLMLVPLIVRMRVIVPSEVVQKMFKKPKIVDFFTQGKAVTIMLICVVMAVMLFFLFDKAKLKKDRYILFYSICAGIFLLFTVVSTIFSEYKDVAIWGIPDRAEGMVIILCYIFIMFYTLYCFNQVNHYKYIIIPLGIITVILTIIGISQWIGKDLMLNTEVGLSLIVPDKYAHLKEALQSRMASKAAYGTFSNPNYMGSFVALVSPIFMTLALLFKDWKKQIIFMILAFCSIFLLVASGSRAGMIGCAVAVISGAILLGRLALQKWVITVSVVLVGVAALIGANHTSEGKLAKQGKKLVTDIVTVIASTDEVQDYKDSLFVREIVSGDKKIIIKTQEDTLTVAMREGSLSFQDEKGQKVQYKEREKYYITKDERFSKIKFIKIFTDNENKKVGGVTLIAGGSLAYLKIDSIQGVYPIDSYTQQGINIIEAPAIGFRGKEREGSGRGYIWSRSIPIFLSSLITGKGPDTFSLYFPQNDYLAKFYALGSTSIVVDKPHNMYLQIGINNSGIALGAFLALMLGYIVQSFRLYSWKKYYTSKERLGIATVLGVTGYLAAGIFNDSVVAIAFIAWVLLGVGISINYLIEKQEKEKI